jgi:hypothetical protein
MLIKAVPGFAWDGSAITVTGELVQKAALWEEEVQREAEEAHARKRRRSRSDMDIDDEEEGEYDGEDVGGDDEEDPEDSLEVKELKVNYISFIRSVIQPHLTLCLGSTTVFTHVATILQSSVKNGGTPISTEACSPFSTTASGRPWIYGPCCGYKYLALVPLRYRWYH